MRLSLRFVVPLLLALALLGWAVVPLVDKLTLQWFVRDLDIRATLVANALQEPLEDLLRAGNRARLEQFFARITQDERLFAIGFCPAEGTSVATSSLPTAVTCDSLDQFAGTSGHVLTSDAAPILVSVRPITMAGRAVGTLVLVHDLSFVARRSEETRKYLFLFFVGLGVTIALITVVIAQLSWRGWVQGMRALLRGEGLLRPSGKASVPELRPIARDLRALIRELETAPRRPDDDHVAWTADTLRTLLRGELRGQEVIVVSNREPYIHMRQNGAGGGGGGGGGPITVWRPASGLVTALEPIMRACSGTWIAHGGGSADREVVDAHDRIAVPPPPAQPLYKLRRVWLTEQQETGYYYGFANEGLWPLCHIAHVRPIFRTSDWEQYAAANRLFARAVVDEARSDDPIVLVHDYHFALLPRLIRESLPEATIITFWHIPWPNPEAFGICPWREEVLDGLLGSSILGFHTQFHCNNFLDTIERLIEARVDREMFTVSYRGELTAVKRYPISIEWPPSRAATAVSVEQCRAAVRQRHGLPEGHAIGLGVDRLDYTKGVEERLRAIERLFELQPEWLGKFTFVQLAAPTRTRIEHYQQYQARVEALAAQINERFKHAAYPAVVLKVEHHEPESVYEYYRGADVCVVTSLHDGMNLVAKEFVAARDDNEGVLVLSQFTGASRELPEAVIVNPYDTDQCAAALQLALTMPKDEQRSRMRLMRQLIKEFNVYRWAGRMLGDAAGMRRRGRLSHQTLAVSRAAL
ncbi:MAG TPA: trehalose-6-phosphate synthase [Gemmatimonadales bacterium]|nr:trehalose-6-phosphate synthase [Gemmatimonadales bacterium]